MKDFSGKCIVYVKMAFTYDQAEQYCQVYRGKLYEPKNLTREAEIREWTVKQGRGEGVSHGPYIGITDRITEGE